MQPIILFGHHAGPNPRKVAMVMEELGIPYEHRLMEITDMKQPSYESINPNGRVPAIQDPNTNITLWESGAIIEYLVETYDKQRSISFVPGSPEAYHAKQWLFFQVSGQGPYFGQAVWFKVHHPERLQSAVDRYLNEIYRVLGVLNNVLKDREYLVGDKFSFVDISFIPWLEVVPWIFYQPHIIESEYINVHTWMQRTISHDGAKKIVNQEVKLPKRS
ncbi:Glutathione S-transferase/chloride channel C-terminal [Penicillium sp. IBT 16267x]|nr:Glutathione S-transferase/chloride channel C-terminal [Penicillium sp. IBT 16267x]